MEDSMSSTNNKNNNVVCSVSGSEENSSWSCYFDESESECSSMFSELMSLNRDHASPIKASFVDHDLEDTAISPIRGPEVQSLDHFSKQLQKQGEYGYKKDLVSQEEEAESNQTGNIIQLGSTELRKHGLCVVPISMLFNF